MAEKTTEVKKPTNTMLIVGLVMVLGGAIWMAYNVVSTPPPAQTPGDQAGTAGNDSGGNLHADA